MNSLLHKITLLILIALLSFGCLQGSPIGSSLVMINSGGVVTNEFLQGERITFIAIMANVTDEQHIIPFETAQIYDLTIFDSDQKLVWAWGSNIIFDPVLTNLVFAPYMVRVYGIFWNQQTDEGQQVSPGIYSVYLENPSTLGLLGANRSVYPPYAGPYFITIKEN